AVGGAPGADEIVAGAESGLGVGVGGGHRLESAVRVEREQRVHVGEHHQVVGLAPAGEPVDGVPDLLCGRAVGASLQLGAGGDDAVRAGGVQRRLVPVRVHLAGVVGDV